MTERGNPAGTHLHVLGRFCLTDRTGQPTPVTRSSQRLLAYLAVSRGPTRRSLVAQSLWAETDDARAASSLRSALWRLPRLPARPMVSVAADSVTLAPEVTVDLWDSETSARALVRADGTAVDDDLVDASLEDDLLPDWSEEWLDIERERYKQLRLHALEERSRRLCARSRHSAALAAALGAVRGEPLRESAHRAVIAVHLAEGNNAEALRQFHAYRRLLARELGLPPSPVIREMVAPLLGRPLEARSDRRSRRPHN